MSRLRVRPSMKSHQPPIGFVLIVAVASAFGQGSAESRPLVRISAPIGVVLHFEATESSLDAARPPTRIPDATVELKTAFELRVLGVKPGVTKLEYRVTRTRGAFEENAGSPFKIDSDTPLSKPKTLSELTYHAFLVADVKRPVVLSVDDLGAIGGIEGVDQLRSALEEDDRSAFRNFFTDAHYRSKCQLVLVQLAPAGVRVGQAWTAQRELHQCRGLGGICENYTLAQRVTRVSDDEITIEGQATSQSSEPDSERAFDASVVARISRQDGLPIESTLTSKTVDRLKQGQRERTMTRRIARVGQPESRRGK